jgi:plastocyanin
VIVTISDNQYTSDTITIAKGTPVRWNNNGPSAHNVTSDDNLFNSGTLAGPGTDAYGTPTAGAQYTRVFSMEGTFGYHCGLHPGMNGAVIVTP